MTRTITHWIGGKEDDRGAERWGDVYNPNPGEVQAQVAMATAEDVDAAVAVASDTWREWRETSLTERMRIMFRFRELFEQSRDELKQIISSEHGKVLADAEGEVRRGQEVVEFACGIGDLLKGAFSEQVSRGIDSYAIRQPLGVVAGITPFNFPAMVPMWMYPVAIACGNAFILKPSEKDPSVSLRMADLFEEAGLPPGVFNVVQGDADTVTALLDHPDVAAVSSVGSTPVARHIYERAGANGKRVQALGGAKNHAVVLPDADLDLAADGIISAAYGSAGERCMAISAVVAVGDVADPLIEALVKRIDELRVGHSLDPDSDMGPLITAAHRERVSRYVEEGVEAGAELVVDGRGTSVEGYPDGFWFGPTLFDHVTTDMSV
ncbi:MAG: CoA-acylating methylmalonate-semialdehyde dehydrogenase, partial [Nitriliruptorales bacterium]|nr:CoA-acylating methylmalonate-semialdehyde dehydrogenase [Nitriliruptorales bacterium]